MRLNREFPVIGRKIPQLRWAADPFPANRCSLPIPGQAVPEAVIGRLVSLEAKLGPRQIEGEGEAGQGQEERGERGGDRRNGGPPPQEVFRQSRDPRSCPEIS